MLRLMHLEVKYGYRLGKSEEEAANSFGFAVLKQSVKSEPYKDSLFSHHAPAQTSFAYRPSSSNDLSHLSASSFDV